MPCYIKATKGKIMLKSQKFLEAKMQNTNLNNKTILITGGTGPILASLANKMKELGYFKEVGTK